MRNKIIAGLLALLGLASSSGSGASAPSLDMSASLQSVAQVAVSAALASAQGVLTLGN
jgi:hypothetical protein